jgi:hypothetical protein
MAWLGVASGVAGRGAAAAVRAMWPDENLRTSAAPPLLALLGTITSLMLRTALTAPALDRLVLVPTTPDGAALALFARVDDPDGVGPANEGLVGAMVVGVEVGRATLLAALLLPETEGEGAGRRGGLGDDARPFSFPVFLCDGRFTRVGILS